MQLCAGQIAGVETVIQFMRSKDDSEAILTVDAKKFIQLIEQRMRSTQH